MVNNKTKKALRQFTPKRTAIATMGKENLELPNLNKGKAPESDRDLANKKYVDDEITDLTTTYLDDHPHQDVNTTASPSFTGLTVDTDTLVVGSNFATFVGPSYPLATFERQVSGTAGLWGVNRYIAKSTSNMGNTFGPAFTFTIEDNASVQNDIVIMGAARDGGDTSGRFQIRTKNAGTYHATGFNIDPINQIGIGTINPLRDVHLYKDINNDVIILIENPNSGNAAHSGFKLANDLGNTNGAVCVFYSSGHSTAANQLYYRNYEGGVKFLAKTGDTVGFGTGTSIADAASLIISDDDVTVSGKNLLFVGDGGLPFGSFYGNEFNQSQAMTTNTEYQVSHASIATGQSHNITTDGNGMFTITKAGKYHVVWAITASHSAVAKHILWGIALDQLLQVDGQQHRETIAADKEYNVSGNGIIDVAVGEDIEIGFKSADGTPGTALISHMSLTVVQVGG